MNLQIGSTLQIIRKNKQIKLKELSTNFLSISQLSHIEKGDNLPSTEKFIYLLSRLNIQYEEFIPLLENEYLNAKHTFGKRLAEFSNTNNIDGLNLLIENSDLYFNKYHDIFFLHIKLQALSFLSLIKNNNFQSAKQYLSPIKEYLLKTENWDAYELTLFGNCLFMFDIDEAIFFGNRALPSIRKNYHIYRNREISCTLLNNLATYSLEHEEHYLFALECSNLSEEYSYSSSDATNTIRANILKQVSYFKLHSSKYNKDKLNSLLEIYQLIGWDKQYNRMILFIKKLEIQLDV